jgi:hypothetical protein
MTTTTDTTTDTTTPSTDQATDTTTTETTVPQADPRAVKLESIALKLRATVIGNAVKLANTFVELYPLAPWTSHADDTGKPLAMAVYFKDVMGISSDNFKMPRDARQAVVKGMFDRDNEPAHVAGIVVACMAMTGASERSITRDRADLGFVDQATSDAHSGPRNGDGDTDGDGDGETRPATRTRVQTVNVVEIIDQVQDVQFLMTIVAHANARMTELLASKPSAFTPAA